jgi:hypothetical protein
MSQASLSIELPLLRDRLIARLAAVRRAMRLHLVAEAAARIAGALTGLAALALLLDWWLELSFVARLCTSAVALALVGYVVWRFLVRPLSWSLAPIEVASVLDRVRRGGSNPPLAPRVASVLQLPDQLDQPGEASPALIEQAVRTSYGALENVDFRASLNRAHLAWSLAALAAAALAPALFAALAPDTATLWAQRWFAGSDQRWPRDTHIEVLGLVDGRLIVPRGEAAGVQVNVTDKAKPTETVWMRMIAEDGRDETVTLTRFGTGDFRYALPPLQLPVDVTVWGGDDRTEPFGITPLDRPRIAALKLIARSPRDPAPTVHTFTGAEGNVRLLPQTEATLELEANVPVSEVRVETDAPDPPVFRATGERTFATSWTHQDALHLRVTLVARDVAFESHPRPISIGQLPDRAPRVSLKQSGVRLRVTPTATIPLAVNSRDDFGIRRVELHVDTSKPGTTGRADPDEPATPSDASAAPPLDVGSPNGDPPQNASAGDDDKAPSTVQPVYGPADPASETNVEHELQLELAERSLQPAQSVAVLASAADDCVTGEQIGHSRKLVFQIVKPEELFREILLRQQQLRARLRKATDQAIDLRDRLRIAVIPDDAPDLARTHQLIRREVGRVSRELDDSVLEMRLNKLGGEETWQLITVTVLQPLARVYEQEMEQQRLALESLSGPQPDPFEEVMERQQSIVDTLSRILDNMAQWDSFIDVVNQLDSVIKLEQAIRQKTEELRKTQVESVFDK